MNQAHLTQSSYDVINLFTDQEPRYVKFLIGYFLAIVDAPNKSSITLNLLDKDFNQKSTLCVTWNYSQLCTEYPRIQEDVELLQEKGNPGGEHIEEQCGVVVAMILASVKLQRRVVEYAKRSAPDLRFQINPLEGIEAAARTGSIKQTIFGTKKKTKNNKKPSKNSRQKSNNKQKEVGKWAQLTSMASISAVHLSVFRIPKNEVFWEKVK